MTLNGPKNRKHTDMILTDFQKEFDTLDHKTSINKMKSISFSNKAIKLVHSYLTKGAFFVSLDTVFLVEEAINYRVPQGSILGSLLL